MVGYDRNGNSAPIEPADVRLDYDGELLEIVASEHGFFTVKAKKEVGSGLVTVKVGGSSTAVPVTIGYESVPVAEEDFTLARRVLDEELRGELPVHYVPGNHEVMGGKIDNFRSVFGDTYGSFDHRGTCFVTLDTSRLNLGGGGFEQVALLRERLDAAAKDPSIGSVAVLFHVPPRDPTPGKGSRLGDRKEAALVEGRLADFQRTTGKGAAYIGVHVPNLHLGSRTGAKPRHVAVLDPVTGTLTALRPGQVFVAVTVNGVTRQSTVALSARSAA